MLNSVFFAFIQRSRTLLASMVLMSFIISCVPQQTATNSVNSASTAGTGTTNNPNTLYPEPPFPLSGIFVQEGAVQTTSNFSLPINFADSYLIRGKTLSLYLRNVPNTTKFCMVSKYNYVAGTDKFLILSAKPKSYTDLVAKTTEFYLQVEPSNDVANQNDCLTYNLTNSLFTNSSSPVAKFSISQLCTDCVTSVTGSGMKLYFINGEEVPTINFNFLNLTISGSTSVAGNTCSDSSGCKARGYDCCLQGQCVDDGAIKPDASTQNGYSSALQDVRSYPDRFILYPQIYFVCDSRPPSVGAGTTTPASDPNYDAFVRLQELKSLYNCLNKVDGEFSYCTVKFTEASKLIGTSGTGSDFSPSMQGFFDDINFSSINPVLGSGNFANNIVKVVYAGETLYEFNLTPLVVADGSLSNTTINDNLSAAQSVRILKTLPASAKDDNLYLTYKIDGTCDKVGTTLAKCTKTYIQSTTDNKLTTWHDSSKVYYLPSYADVSSTSNIIVKISGVVVPEDISTWSKSGAPNRIVFNSSYPIFQNQTIEISYFVNTQVTDLLKSKTAAQAAVNSMCTCGTSDKCNLKPILNDKLEIANYDCLYPVATSAAPPANQTVFVSNKNSPHRYFDANGLNYDDGISASPGQELTPFSYLNGNVLKPSNMTAYTGFNEIYGSFDKTGLTARPAKTVRVKKDQIYDILVNSGAFSSCLTCGSDYYSNLQRIFPQNFPGMGGGYTPDLYASSREMSSSIYRSDDLLFGRACFVPATMIPWTHVSSSSATQQRRTRLAGQHFLFANGYARDWYGFDYGSLIGSFNGVTWFSIGNQRRIKAATGKLFLAVNGYFGDLNVDNSFNVTVSETTPLSPSIADHDSKTEGGECQKAHFCANDNDCFRNLGYDYTCQSITSITTSWPQFDATGAEVTGSLSRSLVSMLGGTNGQAKRCVYRGKGAPCSPNIFAPNTFNGASVPAGTVACSANNYCQNITGAGSTVFNDRIARFANTPTTQNLSAVAGVPTVSDTHGLGARIIGRPYDFYGTKSVPSDSSTSLLTNLVNAVCIPGKNIALSIKTTDMHSRAPAVRLESSDKIWGIGPTMSTTTPDLKYLSACPATDATGTIVQFPDYNLSTDLTLTEATITQNMSSNLLNLNALTSLNVYSSIAGSPITATGYQKNTCLRAPGASCFSDMDCAPSSFVAGKAKSATIFVDSSSPISDAEEKFWEEEMVCGNPEPKTIDGLLNPTFSIKKNICCRDVGKTLTVFTQMDNDFTTNTPKWCNGLNVQVAGVNANINAKNRYSRVHTAYDKLTCDMTTPGFGTTKTFALSIAGTNTTQSLNQILQQYKTLDTINQRTCCTSHWVRSFHPTDNGGGHAFGKDKLQTIDKDMFKNVSWLGDDDTVLLPTPGPDQAFHCDTSNFTNSSCEVKSFTPAEEDLYLTWASSLELIGIPQVAIGTNDQVFQLVDGSQLGNAASKLPLNNSVKTIASNVEDFLDATGLKYYSAASYSKFEMGTGKLKKVFSENEFNCCIPTGQEVTATTPKDQCCTGFIKNVDGPPVCCLPDFTDVSIYLNRYVSSEGRGLPDNAYDPKTGYIKDPGQVKLMAGQKNLCCSGKVMTGVAISQLSIPFPGESYLPPTSLTTSRRFIYSDTAVDSNPETGDKGSIYNLGVRWNNHLYCVPDAFN